MVEGLSKFLKAAKDRHSGQAKRDPESSPALPAKFSAEEAQKAHQASLQIRSFVESKPGERS
jgi:hypothetical protein